MQIDFHYYATYCAAVIAGYSHSESLGIAYSAQFVDCCSRSYLKRIKAPSSAATTQFQLELMDAETNLTGLQEITRIWASFHFLPCDLKADPGRGRRRYRNKFRLICGPNGPLVKETVETAKGRGIEAAGVAMHVIADTWAHRYFAGTTSLVINNTNYYFYELLKGEGGEFERPVTFRHSPGSPDDLEAGVYTNTVLQPGENTIMNLGHGRAGHLPDYSFMRYRYMPAWADYREVVKDNPSDYYSAFCQMICALKYLRGSEETFETDRYDWEAVRPYEARIRAILEKRQADASGDWKAFGEELTGKTIFDFNEDQYAVDYLCAGGDADGTPFGRFIRAALAQKSMVTNQIYRSGSPLAGISVDYKAKGLRGVRDYFRLAEEKGGEGA